MPRGRRPAAVKAAEEKAALEAAKVTEEKVVVTEAVEEKAEEVKTPAKRGRKPGSKNVVKTEEVKAEETKTTTKAAGKAVDSNVVLQFEFGEFATADIVEKCIKAYEAENKTKVKKINVYVKPADMKVYYVVNDKVAGSIDL